MNVLVTGGAGYIGSIVVETLLESGSNVVAVDNLQQGHRQAVLPDAQLVKTDIRNEQSLEKVFKARNFEAVIHMAAETVVEFSMTNPDRYFSSNVIGGINLLNLMRKYGVKKMVFSSTAAVYGEPEKVPIKEDHPKKPTNSYGESKLIFERILDWYARAYDIKYIAFRYFCAAGASKNLGEDHKPETHLVPNVLKAAVDQKPVPVFGDDYSTKDGSCIRDFIHVKDISAAHILAIKKIGKFNNKILNLGNGVGYSVLEVIESAKRVTGKPIKFQIKPRRSGDPSILIASAEKAIQDFGWQPQYTNLDSIIETAWRWQREHLDGYRE